MRDINKEGEKERSSMKESEFFDKTSGENF